MQEPPQKAVDVCIKVQSQIQQNLTESLTAYETLSLTFFLSAFTSGKHVETPQKQKAKVALSQRGALRLSIMKSSFLHEHSQSRNADWNMKSV